MLQNTSESIFVGWADYLNAIRDGCFVTVNRSHLSLEASENVQINLNPSAQDWLASILSVNEQNKLSQELPSIIEAITKTHGALQVQVAFAEIGNKISALEQEIGQDYTFSQGSSSPSISSSLSANSPIQQETIAVDANQQQEKKHVVIMEKADSDHEKEQKQVVQTEAALVTTQEKILLLQLVKRRVAVLLLLQKKIKKHTCQHVLDSLDEYNLGPEDRIKVMYALLNGDLRLTDVLNRGILHFLWCVIAFKWGNIAKKLSRAEVMQVANCSWEGRPFVRNYQQQRNRLLKGIPLVVGKVVTSAALCFVFCMGVGALIGLPSLVIIIGSAILASCNAAVCWLSRGKAMLDCVGFEPKKQATYATAHENMENKPFSRWVRRVFFGFLTFIACVSAGATAWGGVTGLLMFFGIAVTFSNPFILIAVAGLALIAAISFYAFQATDLEKNYLEYKSLFEQQYAKNGICGIICMMLVSIIFLGVYAILTWFTVATGINKIFDTANIQEHIWNLALSGISTLTTMFVNTFSQVVKVFNPQTYVQLVEQVKICSTSRWQAFWKTLVLLGNELAYSIAGGVKSGMEVGSDLGSHIGSAITGAIIFAIFSPLILLFVSIAFTWPAVFKHDISGAAKHISLQSTVLITASTMDDHLQPEAKVEDKCMPSAPLLNETQQHLLHPAPALSFFEHKKHTSVLADINPEEYHGVTLVNADHN